ncbi:hypothetical protein H9L10_06885 [Phycicoccus endophyticus]|uniref:DUF2029 domain-containing protein n=1 Tax=Phycicoccus endophyticus TaxID=1690220 RepID=A0A7G9R4Y6_9MICO|nr:hypothetical protein [Phycicoccus endophyticus]QNN50661.1 hypothetical protein H9L10_06885 [Phycicoccus endophyticus]GGL22587.1 hypothetical protein GCM10012283_00780 [Phycicoccus endophyticus]
MADPGARVATRGPLRLPEATLAVAWLAWFAAAQWSVVRFRVPILLTLTACTALLAWWLVRRHRLAPGRWLAAGVVLGSVLLTLTVPLFTYLRGGWLSAALTVTTGAGVACAGLLLAPGRRARGAALGVAALAHVVVGALTVLGDRAPRIDVWVILQQGADVTGRLGNVYTAQWSGSPGVQDHFTYLPWMAVLTAPGRWLAGDVRWALLAWGLVLLAGLWALAGGRSGTGRAAAGAAVLVLAPGTLTQVDQAWTEPVLAALLVWWAALVRRGHAWWAVLPLALACASKQHLALLAPVLLVWRPFGWRRTLATGALATVLVLPWVLASPTAFVEDTVTTLLGFHPIRFANTWYLFFLHEYGVSLPFAVTGTAMAGAVGIAAWVVYRRRPPVEELLRWLALVLAVANLVNKQAFYNQFWLVAVLVLASLVVPPTRTAPEPAAGEVTGPGRRGVGASPG